MGRAALKWTISDLATCASVGRATVARFELGEPVQGESVAKIRKAMEAAGVRFVDKGKLAGAVVFRHTSEPIRD